MSMERLREDHLGKAQWTAASQSEGSGEGGNTRWRKTAFGWEGHGQLQGVPADSAAQHKWEVCGGEFARATNSSEYAVGQSSSSSINLLKKKRFKPKFGARIFLVELCWEWSQPEDQSGSFPGEAGVQKEGVAVSLEIFILYSNNFLGAEHKFDLAIQLGDLDCAYTLAKESASEQKWKQLAEIATSKAKFEHEAQDHGGKKKKKNYQK